MPGLKKILALSSMCLLTFITTGCATQAPYDYTEFKKSHPASILILPPVNSSSEVRATYSMLAQMTYPLAESGYYVVPVALADETFKQNGYSSAGDIQTIPADKLRQIFGADAALYVNIKDYGVHYQIIDSVVSVAAEGRLVDLRTGQTIWTGNARASSSENNNSNNAGLLGLLVKAIVNQVVNSVSERAHPYAGIASQRLLTAGGNGRILYGPRSLRYGTD